jgi:hypothetical protein
VRVAVTFTSWPWQQPDERTWDVLVRFTDEWNAKHATRWTASGEGYSLEFADTSAPEYGEAARLIEQLRKNHRAQVDTILLRQYDEGDFEAADLVLIDGFELHSYVSLQEERPAGHGQFVCNLESNWSPPSPCRGCGWSYAYSGEQLGPFIIDEWYLHHRYDHDARRWVPLDRPWDLVTIPGGVLLASTPVVDALQAHRVKGYHTTPVKTRGTGETSGSMVQVVPDRWIDHLCAEHSQVTGGVCPTCGRVLGEIEGVLHLLPDATRGQEVVGRRPGGLRVTYVAQRVYRLLKAVQARGLEPDSPAYLCQHGVGHRSQHGLGGEA